MKINTKHIVFAILLLLAFFYWFLFDFLRWIQFDTPSFVGGSRLMFGLEGGFSFQSRLSKPLVLILPGLFEKVLAIHPYYTFVFQNIICYFLSGFLVYDILNLIFKKKKIAIAGMLAYVMCQVFAIFSFVVMSDVVGWCMGLFVIYLTIKWLHNKEYEASKILIISIVSGISMFTKESAIIGFVFLVFFLLFQQNNIWFKVKTLMISICGFLIIFVLGTIAINFLFETSVLKRISETREYYGVIYYRLSDITQIFRTLDMNWILIIIGVPQIIRVIKSKNQIALAAFCSFLVVFLTMPIHPFCC
jgi:hypothetical protein